MTLSCTDNRMRKSESVSRCIVRACERKQNTRNPPFGLVSLDDENARLLAMRNNSVLQRIPRGRTLRWIVAACGRYRARVGKVVAIRRDALNRRNVLRYLLKATDPATGRALDLQRCGEAGRIIGKRVGFTANLGPAARRFSINSGREPLA